METQVRTPQMVFMQPQRLVVPLFQRPYVWNEENQWEPLWNDLIRVAERILKKPTEKHHPHFLGAVVLQQTATQIGLMQERTIIDGQQRLTTLQLLLDAMAAELHFMKALLPAKRLEPLVTNAEPFRSKPEDQFKVWPTNRDRPAFNAVMEGDGPLDYDTLGYAGERIVQAHRFFSQQCREWLSADGSQAAGERGEAIETVARELIQMVVIDLAPDENAQEIFETLNARGVQLTAADLIKNFIFQRLLEKGTNVELAYQRNWKDFETGFWETEVSVGRLRYPRSALFLNHWLIARRGEEVVAREVFDRFKRFADYEAGVPMQELLEQIRSAAGKYRDFVTAASTLTGPATPLALFGYRTSVLESEVIKPLVLFLLDPDKPALPEAQFLKALEVVESWMVRRMLVRASTKSYTQIVAELITDISRSNRANAGDLIESYFARQSSGSRYWPSDKEVREELESVKAYRRLGRGRLRMVLEALEDHLRGWKDGHAALGEERVARGKLAIEHIIPRKWQRHWPVQDPMGEETRNALIDTLGNLTLLTKRLNSKASNAAWIGKGGKRKALEEHDVLVLNREVVKADLWTDQSIQARTQVLTEIILQIWPVPAGHDPGPHEGQVQRRRKKVGLADLIAGVALEPGMTLFPRQEQYLHRVVTLLPDGRVEVDGVAYSRPSQAASAITGKRTNGWWFFLTDQFSRRRSLRDVRQDYVEALAVDAEDEDIEGEGEDEEA